MTQSYVTRGSARTIKHAKRMNDQLKKRVVYDQYGFPHYEEIKVPRGTARNERRKPLQKAYAIRVARGQV